MKTGKVMAGWSTGENDSQFTSGCPPNLKDIKTDIEKVDGFVETLLGNYKEVKPQIKRMLVANVLRFWKDFIQVISQEEKGKYQKVSNHPFVQKVSLPIHPLLMSIYVRFILR